MRIDAPLASLLLLCACKDKAKDTPASTQAPAPGSGAPAAPGSAAATKPAEGSVAPAAAMERKDLSKLSHPVPASVEVPAGVKIEASEVGYGQMDGKTDPTAANAVDIHGTGWTVRIERVRDVDAATAADATRDLSLKPDMVLTSETLPDGGWMLVYKVNGEHWLKSVHKAAKVVCDSNGPSTKEQVDTVAKICKTVRPAK